ASARKASNRRRVRRGDFPVFGRTGNFNSLFGEKISLFARVGNFPGTALNRWAFRDGFSENWPKRADFPVLFPIGREFGRARGSAPIAETRAHSVIPVFRGCACPGVRSASNFGDGKSRLASL